MDSPADEGKRARELGTYRDTVESIGVAIILAFVLRAFVVEAFVIPTGSMAPRLLGQHWDVTCPTCGYSFAYGYSGGPSRARPDPTERIPPGGARCPNCRTPYDAARHPEYLSSGDRVLVMKYIYDFAPPEPWDVVVFKNPQDNRENYIKRLIGLPGETIEIVHGDIFVSDGPDSNLPRSIRRKPPKAQEAMWQVVFDNDYRPDPARPGAARSPAWTRGQNGVCWDLEANDGRCFLFEPRGEKSAAEIFLQADPAVFHPSYGYNFPDNDDRQFDPRVDVCTDLKLSAVLMPGADGPSTVTLKLSSFQNRFEAEFHADGAVFLTCLSSALPGGRFSKPARVAPFRHGRGRTIALTNVDFRAAVWVDGRCVLETTDDEYPSPVGANVPGRLYRGLSRQMGEQVPLPDVKISAQGSGCELRHVALHRDVYYTSARQESIPQGPLGEYASAINQAHDHRARARWPLGPGDVRHRRVDGGRGWGTPGNPITLARNTQDPDLDEFFCLGDNSPASRDGRSWTSAAPTLRLYNPDGSFLYQLGTVPRYNLLGKAMFVYWPGGFRLPLLRNLPIVPNVGKMRFIR